ncbi:MAG: AI-2E family transporter [Bacillus sp. (in: firmicutes)]
MKISVNWFYRLGFLLLVFFTILLFFKLKPIWLPILEIFGLALLPFVLAAFISYLLHPVVEKLYKRGLHRSISILLIYFVFFGGLGFSIYKGIPVVVHELDDLMKSTPYFTEKYTSILDSIDQKTSNWPSEYKERIQDGILFFEKKVESLLSKVMGYLVNMFDFVVIFAIVPLIAFYFLKDWELMKRAAWYITPAKIRKQSAAFMQDVEQSLGNYIRGQIIVCILVGAISALLLWLIKVKYSLLLGIIIGITNVIPYFGPIIGAIPAMVIAAATNPHHIIWVAVIVFGLQFIEGNILSPLIVGKSLHMHPLLIMLSLFIGGEVGGVLGLIVAVPVLAVAKVAIMHAKVHFMKVRQRQRL